MASKSVFGSKKWAGAGIAIAIAYGLLHTTTDIKVIVLLFAGLPYGWTAITRIIPIGLTGSLVIVIPFLMIKFVLAVLIGVVVLPIMSLYYIVRMIFAPAHIEYIIEVDESD